MEAVTLENNRKLEAKLALIRGIYVQKAGKSVYGKMAKYADILERLREPCEENEVTWSCMPVSEGGLSGVQVRVTDLETGYFKQTTIMAERGVEEKLLPFFSVGKNLTYLMRYAPMVVFGIDTGEDPESAREERKPFNVQEYVMSQVDKMETANALSTALNGKSAKYVQKAIEWYNTQFAGRAGNEADEDFRLEVHETLMDELKRKIGE